MSHHNLANELSWLPWSASDAQSILVSDGLTLLIHPDQRHGVHKRQEDGGEAHAARLAVNVQNVGVSFGSAIELSYKLDSKSVYELLPDAWSESISPHDLHIVTAILRRLRSGQQVTTNFSNVLSTLQTRE